MKIFKFLIIFLAAVLIFTACGGAGGDEDEIPVAEDSFFSFKAGSDGWLDEDIWVDWSGGPVVENGQTVWIKGAVIQTDGKSPSGKPYLMLPGTNRSDSWHTVSAKIYDFLYEHGSGYYRYGCKARVDSASQTHYGNIGHRVIDTWPTFNTINSWTVQVGTSWTDIKTSDQGTFIDVSSANGYAFLTYKGATSTDTTGGWVYYYGEVYLADWYLEFLGS